MKDAVITSSILIICITIIRQLCRGKISARLQYALWLIVAVRLIVPLITAVVPNLLPQSEFSIMNVAGKVESAAQDYIQPPEQIRQINLHIGDLPFLNIANEDGPTAVFVAGKVGGTWIDFFKGIWYAGMIIAGIWIVGVNILFMHNLHKSRIKYEKEDYSLPIYLVNGLVSPCLYGLPKRQAVYIPKEIQEDERKLRHILAHEYCHYKHMDVIWAGLRCILMTVYWFNPFVWLAAVLSKQDCELACDESAIKMLGEEERIEYGKTLLDLITKRTKASDIVCAATTMTGGDRGIKERIKRIAEKPHRLAIILLVVLVAVGVTVAFTFTGAKEEAESFSDMSEDSDLQTVTTESFQITFPEQLLQQIYYITENDTDVIIYHKDYNKEIGRFCRITYWEAAELADEREVILIGDYGKNPELKNHIEGNDNDTSSTMHEYYEDEAADGEGIPGTDSNNDDTTYLIEDSVDNTEVNSAYEAAASAGVAPIPAPEEVESESINLPYYENEDYSASSVDKNDNSISSHDYAPDEVTDDADLADGKHYYLPDESINVGDDEAAESVTHIYTPYEVDDDSDVSTIVLPEEKITTQSIPSKEYCYLYIPTYNSELENSIREEFDEINNALIDLSDSVSVLYISEAAMEEILEALVEKRNQDIADWANTSEIANMLPETAGLSYTMLEYADKEPYAVTLHYRLLADDILQIDNDMLFLNAVLTFSLVENMETCSFKINGDINEIKYSGSIPDDFTSVRIDYEREEMEALFGELYPCSESKEQFEELYNKVISYCEN